MLEQSDKLEITEKQLLSFNSINRARILKYIALGLIEYIPSLEIQNYNHIPRID